MDRDELEGYQKKAIANALPGFGSWLAKHQLAATAFNQMGLEQIMAVQGKFLQMYEREMGKVLDPDGVGSIPFDDEPSA